MKQLILFVFLGACATGVKSQPNDSASKSRLWMDTSYVVVTLPATITGSRLVACEVGQKAIIYLRLQDVRAAIANASRGNYQNAGFYIDSVAALSDTIRVPFTIDMDDPVASLLIKGQALVFYKKEHRFVPAISYGLERYGTEALRFFYLPNQRVFFSRLEYTGIVVNGKYLSSREDLTQLYNKLSDIRKE